MLIKVMIIIHCIILTLILCISYVFCLDVDSQ